MDLQKRNAPAQPEESTDSLPPLDSAAYASKGMCIAALVVGALGIVVGISGVMAGNGAKDEVEALRQQVSSANPADSLKAQLQELEGRIAKVETLASRTTNMTRELETKLAELRNAFAADHERLVKLAEAPAPARVTTAPAAQGGSGGESTGVVNAAGQIEHTIQSGDTFSGLAKTYGVTVEAIQNANPNANPNRLQLGQKIIIPQAKH
jgi:LysM repeat protein